jgi:outer membrane protein assembly factor BamB
MSKQILQVSRRSFLGNIGGLMGFGMLGGYSATVDPRTRHGRAQEVSTDDDWDQYRGDAAHTSALLGGSGPTGNITKAWSGTYGYASNADVAVIGDDVYIADTSLVAANAADGSEQWEFTPDPSQDLKAGTPHIRSPAVVDDTVYASIGFGPFDTSGTWDSALVAIDADTGTQRWRINTEGETRGAVPPVTVANDTVFAALPGQQLTAYATDGSVRWRQSNEQGRPGPVADGRMYLGGQSGVRALDVRTGEVVWKALPQVANVYASMVYDGMLFVTESDSPGVTLIALDAATGDEYWRTAYPSEKTNEEYPYLVVGTADTETVYIQTNLINGYVIALNRTNGHERWRKRISDGSSGSISNLMRVGNLLYVGSSALDPTDGTFVWKYSFPVTGIGFNLVAVAGGQCYFAGGRIGGDNFVVLTGTTNKTTQPTQSTQMTSTQTPGVPTQTPPATTPTETAAPQSSPMNTVPSDRSPATPNTTSQSPTPTNAQTTSTNNMAEKTTTTFGPGFGVLTAVAGAGLGAWRYLNRDGR